MSTRSCEYKLVVCCITGDFAYVQQMGVKTVITRIDRMWTNSAGDAFIYGPTYVHPSDTEHQPTRTFYVSPLSENMGKMP